jgi:DNA-binding XRE family transcriptional regulator
MRVKDPDKLRQRRRAKYSQKQLAALVDCTQQYISLLEKGTDTDCSERIAERICHWLDVDLEDYFETNVVVRTSAVATASRGSSDGTAACGIDAKHTQLLS